MKYLLLFIGLITFVSAKEQLIKVGQGHVDYAEMQKQGRVSYTKQVREDKAVTLSVELPGAGEQLTFSSKKYDIGLNKGVVTQLRVELGSKLSKDEALKIIKELVSNPLLKSEWDKQSEKALADFAKDHYMKVEFEKKGIYEIDLRVFYDQVIKKNSVSIEFEADFDLLRPVIFKHIAKDVHQAHQTIKLGGVFERYGFNHDETKLYFQVWDYVKRQNTIRELDTRSYKMTTLFEGASALFYISKDNQQMLLQNGSSFTIYDRHTNEKRLSKELKNREIIIPSTDFKKAIVKTGKKAQLVEFPSMKLIKAIDNASTVAHYQFSQQSDSVFLRRRPAMLEQLSLKDGSVIKKHDKISTNYQLHPNENDLVIGGVDFRDGYTVQIRNLTTVEPHIKLKV